MIKSAANTVLLLIFLSQVAHSAADPEALDLNLSKWMGRCPHRTIMQLTIPVSHDSCTYRLSKTGRLLAKNITECQILSIREQLDVGIRGLDIRVNKFDEDTGKISTHHGPFRCADFDECLTDVMRFLSDNPTEIVFFRCKIKNKDDIPSLRERIGVKIENHADKGDITRISLAKAQLMTVAELVANNQRLVMMLPNDEGNFEDIMIKTYKETKTHSAKELTKNLNKLLISLSEEFEHETFYKHQKPLWVSMQVTDKLAALPILGGYKTRSRNVAENVLGRPVHKDIMNATRGKSTNRIVNFVTTDMAGQNEAVQEFVVMTIEANMSVPKVTPLVQRCVKCRGDGCTRCSWVGFARLRMKLDSKANDRPMEEDEFESDLPIPGTERRRLLANKQANLRQRLPQTP